MSSRRGGVAQRGAKGTPCVTVDSSGGVVGSPEDSSKAFITATTRGITADYNTVAYCKTKSYEGMKTNIDIFVHTIQVKNNIIKTYNQIIFSKLHIQENDVI